MSIFRHQGALLVQPLYYSYVGLPLSNDIFAFFDIKKVLISDNIQCSSVERRRDARDLDEAVFKLHAQRFLQRTA